MTRAGGGDTNICSYVCVFVNLLVRPGAPDYTKTGRDRKFGTIGVDFWEPGNLVTINLNSFYHEFEARLP